MITLAAGTKMTCADAVKQAAEGQAPLGGPLRRQGLQGRAVVRLGLDRRPPPRGITCWSAATCKTGELAFHYCYVPEGQLLTKTRLIRAAGLRWPVEEDFGLGKDCLGLDQCQARLYTAIHPPHRAGHGRPGDLRRHRRTAERPHRHPGPAARPAPTRHHPADPG